MTEPTTATWQTGWTGVCALARTLSKKSPPGGQFRVPGLLYVVEDSAGDCVVDARDLPRHRSDGDDHGVWTGWSESQLTWIRWTATGSDAVLLAQSVHGGWLVTYTGPPRHGSDEEPSESNYFRILITVSVSLAPSSDLVVSPATNEARRLIEQHGLAMAG